MRGRHTARWTAIGIAFALILFGVVLAVQKRDEPSVPRLVQTHEAAPTFSTKALDGSPVTSAALRGKTYVVNVWNTWCIPCQQESGALQAFYVRHKDDPDFAMVGLVRDDDKGPVQSYVADKRIGWPVVFDDDLLAAFGTTGQPETYVIGPKGTAACGRLGATSLDELEAWLQTVRAGGVCS